MNKLKTILKSNYLYYYLITIFLLVVSLNLYFIFILLVIYLIVFKKRYNHKIMFSVLVFIILFFSFYKKIETKDYINDNYTITDYTKYENSNKYTIKKGMFKYIFYSNSEYEIGSKIKIKGDITPFDKYYTPGAFDRNKYYRSVGIYGEVKNFKIESLNKKNYLYSIQSLVKDPLLKVFLGSEKLDEENNTINNLNIYYLISLSGIHIYFILAIIDKVLFNFNVEMKKQDLIKLVVVILFLAFSGFKTTILRITIYQVLKFLKRHYYGNITNFTLMNLSFFLVIFIRPYLMMNLSYLITYLIVNSILLFSELINSNSLIKRQIKTNFLVSLVTLPFFSKINLLSIILNPLYYFLIINIMFPLSIINNFIKLTFINKLNVSIFNFINITNITKYNLTLFKLSSLLISLYLVFLILIIVTRNKKRLISLILLILVIVTPGFKRYIKEDRLYFLDVGQGDSSVYITSDLVIVVDAFRNVKTFLEHEGIRKIDYLIISHNHLDHMMEFDSLINSFDVKNIVVSTYSDYQLSNKINLIKAKSGTTINDTKVSLYFYGPIKDYLNENNNSLVFKLTTNDFSVLYTGDIETLAENDLVDKYQNELNANYLKVSHHGSKTSSTFSFIESINPNHAIISVGRNNSYGFPSTETLETFNNLNINILRTDLLGTIVVKKDNQIIEYKK